jgi:hypothetical protein
LHHRSLANIAREKDSDVGGFQRRHFATNKIGALHAVCADRDLEEIDEIARGIDKIGQPVQSHSSIRNDRKTGLTRLAWTRRHPNEREGKLVCF